MNRNGMLAATRLFIASLALAAAGALAADATVTSPNLNGNWKTSFESEVGTQEYTYTFKTEAGKLTGHAKSNLGEGPITDIKIEKDTVTFIEHLDYQGMELAITTRASSPPPTRSSSSATWLARVARNSPPSA